ncbi:flavin reductase family protein [Phenylobacterium sp.]|uniref:flavin reductase family protein n=1 Tax=Phenylobacterium sp. TaxID=1871053 RepID=UPI00272F70FF|nr:flavin reductase family protein [Phenylobacterium sp.]MDP2215561.1 flavin reductase family protein [Phenylobacterium sp.]
MGQTTLFGDAEVAEPLDPLAWRAAMGAFASGVVIVTTQDEAGQPVGTTVSAFSSVSLDPPLLLVCLDHKSRTRAAVKRSGHFCINILAAGQGALARLFAGPGATDRFADVEITPGVLGAPQIAGALASIDCRLHSLHAAGDHDILIGRGLNIAAAPGDPLIYSQGRFLGPAD